MKLIGLTGYARSGKDAAASFLVERGWKRLAFADAVRKGLLAMNPIITGSRRLKDIVDEDGWDYAKLNPEVRRLLQVYGTEAGRDIHGSCCWADIVACQIVSLRGNYHIVVTDVRFREEVRMIQVYGGQIIRIAKPGVGPVNDHKSDTAIDRIQEDSWIANDGTLEDLKRKILKAAHVAEGV